jgi:oxygen-dependent protoporphyrinogen oxidase
VSVKIAVVGGGIAGLAAARRLVAGGADVTVYEAAARPGGVLGTSRADGFLREHAATAVLAAPGGLVELAAELGVEMQAASPAAVQRWIWIDGALHALPRGPVDFVKSDLLTWRGKLALLGEPFRAARDPSRAGDESVYDFAVRRLGPEAARALIAPFVTGVYAADAHDVSLASGFPAFAELDAKGGLVRGMLFGRRGGRDGRRAKRARGLFAPAGGMQAIVDALAASLGARVKLSSPIASIAPRDRGVFLDVGGEVVRFDAAVLTVSASAAARLVSASVPPLAAALAGFVRAPAAIVYLGFAAGAVPRGAAPRHGSGRGRGPRGAAPRHGSGRGRGPRGADGFGFLVAQGEALRVLGVVMESVVWPDRAPSGGTLLRCIFAGARDPDAFALDDAALIAHAKADVARALEVTAAPIHASVVRWKEGVAQMPVGHRERLATVDGLARGARLVLGGAGFHGVAVNDLVADAKRIADEVASWG